MAEQEKPDQIARPITGSRATLWLWLPLWCLPLGLPLLHGALFQFPSRIVPLYLLAIAAALLVFLIIVTIVLLTIFAAVAGHWRLANAPHWRHAVMLGSITTYMIAEIRFPALFWQPLYDVGLTVGFVPFSGDYEAKVAALPKDRGPRVLVIDFGFAGLLGHALVFDESDFVAGSLKPGGPGIIGPGVSRIGSCDSLSTPLGRHFYACIYTPLS